MSSLTTISYDQLESYNVMDLEKDCRYSLVREWDASKPKATIIMHNPGHLNPNP